MGETDSTNLLPFTLLDLMIFVAGFAVSSWLVASDRSNLANLFPPRDMREWCGLAWALAYGLTVVAPVIVGVQFWRGRRRWPLPGEIAWLIIAIELLPVLVFVAILKHSSPNTFDTFWVSIFFFYFVKWLGYGSPPLVLICALAAVVWHFRTGRPRHWSHRFGLIISLAQCVLSALRIVTGFG